jgi:hypothetical protein
VLLILCVVVIYSVGLVLLGEITGFSDCKVQSTAFTCSSLGWTVFAGGFTRRGVLIFDVSDPDVDRQAGAARVSAKPRGLIESTQGDWHSKAHH